MLICYFLVVVAAASTCCGDGGGNVRSSHGRHCVFDANPHWILGFVCVLLAMVLYERKAHKRLETYDGAP